MARSTPNARKDRRVYSSMEEAKATRATEQFHADAPKHQRGTFTASETGAKQAANLRYQAELVEGLRELNKRKRAIIKNNRRIADKAHPGFNPLKQT